MTEAIKRRRGTTAEHATFTGLEAEVTIDTTKDTAIVHDGETPGGIPLAREDLANAPVFVGATEEEDGVKGLVVPPPAGTATRVMYSNGVWGEITITNVAIISADVDPTDDVGDDGQYWMNTMSHTMFGPKANGEWPEGFSVIGPRGEQGIQGEKGDTGDAGADGNTVLYGARTPIVTDGEVGNFWINTANWTLFGPKTAEEWPLGTSIIGPKGDKGDKGDTGDKGDKGDQGFGMPPGGAENDFLQKSSEEDYEYFWSRELKNPLLTGYSETIKAHGSNSGPVVLSLAEGSIHTITLTGEASFSVTGVVAGRANTITLIVTNPDGYSFIPPTGTMWPGGFVPDFDVEGTSIYGFTTMNGGTNWFGITTGQGFQ